MQHRALPCSVPTPHLAKRSAIFANKSCPCFKGARMFYLLLLPTTLSPFLPLSFSCSFPFCPCYAWVEGRAYWRALHVLSKYSLSYTPKSWASPFKADDISLLTSSQCLESIHSTLTFHQLCTKRTLDYSLGSGLIHAWIDLGYIRYYVLSFSKMGRVCSGKGSAVLRIFETMCFICYLLYVYHQESCLSFRQYTTLTDILSHEISPTPKRNVLKYFLAWLTYSKLVLQEYFSYS